MVESLTSWILENKKLIVIVSSILVIAIILILIGYQIDWTGFNSYPVAVTTNATKTTLPTNITVTLPSKNLYDWLQLLIILVVIAVAGCVINFSLNKTERDLALDRQHEATLKEYIDKMSELILHENLRTSSEGDEVRNIAYNWTALTLSRLDAIHKRNVLEFLCYSKLIEADNIIDLNGAVFSGVSFSGNNLRGINLSNAFMDEADLSDVDLRESNLRGTNMEGADLSGADLSDANLTGATVTDKQLAKVKSLKGATMPDGSIHD